jgi:hypothetical protein
MSSIVPSKVKKEKAAATDKNTYSDGSLVQCNSPSVDRNSADLNSTQHPTNQKLQSYYQSSIIKIDGINLSDHLESDYPYY